MLFSAFYKVAFTLEVSFEGCIEKYFHLKVVQFLFFNDLAVLQKFFFFSSITQKRMT